MKQLLLILITLSLFHSITSAQQINPDGTITFTFCVPEADDVILRGDVEQEEYKVKTPFKTFTRLVEHKLQQTNDTTWTVTIPPLAPDMYMYYFEVDGEDDGDSLDVSNPLRVRDGDKWYSAFIYPGGSADNYLDNPAIPHGTILKSWYLSSLRNSPLRRMTIYLPPTYTDTLAPAQSGSAAPTIPHYPVLYLFHGTGGDANSWIDCGRARQIFDNLIATGKMAPMIVVMPDCNLDNDIINPDDDDPDDDDDDNDDDDDDGDSNGNLVGQFGRFETYFVHDVVAHVDSMFLTIPDKAHRAIAGISLGGMQALYTALNNPDIFGYIGLFSAQTQPYYTNGIINRMQATSSINSSFARAVTKMMPFIGDKMKRNADIYEKNLASLDIYKDLDKKLNTLAAQKPQLFYIACGKDDFVYSMNKSLRSRLTKANCPFTYNETDGAHTWSNWRRYLMDFLPRLF